MNIILFGYNGSLGRVVLEDLFQKYKKIYNFKIICIGRDAKSKPFKNKKIIYVEWDFLNFSKLNSNINVFNSGGVYPILNSVHINAPADTPIYSLIFCKTSISYKYLIAPYK